MFTFNGQVPDNIRLYLIPFLQAWIDRAQSQLYSLDTTRYGLVTFRRDPWPLDGNPTVVAPAGEQDAEALVLFSNDPNR